jgi:hypothetical protein
MRKVKVVLDFLKFPVSEKIIFYRNVITSLTGNPAFATPDVSLTNLTTVLTAFEQAEDEASDGARTSIALRNQAEEVADKAFRKEAMYVDRISDGDAAIILSSGFHLSKQPEPAQRPLFEAEAGNNSGEIILTRKAQPGAKSYVWQYCIGSLPVNGAGNWIFAGSSTQSKYVISNLESGSKCWFRVAAVTIGGMAPWTDPVMKVVP